MRIRSIFSCPFPFFLFIAHPGKGSKGVEVCVFEDILGFIVENSDTIFSKYFSECHSIGYVHFCLTNGFTYIGYEHFWKVKGNFIYYVIHDS